MGVCALFIYLTNITSARVTQYLGIRPNHKTLSKTLGLGNLGFINTDLG